MVATGQLDAELLDGHAFIGELGLDGSMRPVIGTLPLCEAAGDLRPVVAHADAAEAALVRPDACCARTLSELAGALRGDLPWPDGEPRRSHGSGPPDEPDLGDVQGQTVARRSRRRQPAATICSCRSARLAGARPCWMNASPDCSPI